MILDEIEKSVAWLKANVTNPDLNAKIAEAERLATNSYYLASLVADYHEKANTSEFLYKSSVDSFVATSELPVGRAEYKAKDMFKELNKAYRDAESMHRRLQLALSQCNTIIEQIRQSNSYHKQERRFETHG